MNEFTKEELKILFEQSKASIVIDELPVDCSLVHKIQNIIDHFDDWSDIKRLDGRMDNLEARIDILWQEAADNE